MGCPERSAIDPEDLAGLYPQYRFLVGLGHPGGGYRHEAREEVGILAHGLFQHGGADHVDANAPWQLAGGPFHEVLDGTVDGGGAHPPVDGLLAQNAADEGDGATVAQVGNGGPGQVDLAHQLALKPHLPLLVRHLGSMLSPKLQS